MEKRRLHPHGSSLRPLKTGVVPSGRLSPPVDAVLFDIYGTLFISGSGDIGAKVLDGEQNRALAELLGEFNIHTSPKVLTSRLHEVVRSAHGVARKMGIAHPEVVIEKIWEQILPFQEPEHIRTFALRYEHIVNPVAPMPGIGALLESCRVLNLVMGIVSNAQFYTPLLFDIFLNASPESLGFGPELILYSFQAGVAKPDATLFERARDILTARKIPPARVVYVGNDMRNDILPARRVGFQTALFAGDARSLRLRTNDPCCRGSRADLVVTGLEQLTNHFFRARNTAGG